MLVETPCVKSRDQHLCGPFAKRLGGRSDRRQGWLYVAAVIDLFSHRVVGWSMKTEMTAGLVSDALVMAIWRRGCPHAFQFVADFDDRAKSEPGSPPRGVRLYSTDGGIMGCTVRLMTA